MRQSQISFDILNHILNLVGSIVTSEVTYWVAGHLTGIFEIKDSSKNLLEKGSLGAGLSISRGVKTTVSYDDKPKVDIYFNGNKMHSSNTTVTRKIIEFLVPLKERIHFQIKQDFEVPLSTGFGASAAGALGCAFSINDYFELEMSKIKLFQIAHQVEVLLKSGLGDIIGLYQGGLEIRTKEGAPGFGRTIAFTNDQDWKLATISFGSLPTAEVLSDPNKRKLINSAGNKMIKKLIKNPVYSEFINLTKKFTLSASLTSPKMQKFFSSVPEGIDVAQIMLGDSLFLFYQDDDIFEDFSIDRPSLQKEDICQITVIKGKK
jgi:pantoate kinase